MTFWKVPGSAEYATCWKNGVFLNETIFLSPDVPWTSITIKTWQIHFVSFNNTISPLKMVKKNTQKTQLFQCFMVCSKYSGKI